jgi:D-alanyl-lipoteichoic acid acyltransferase DltB (MBOAT superfamily)
MSFISLQFLVFFMVVTLSYYQLRNQRMRIALLLAASCYFYMSFVPIYILILGGTIVIDYLAGLQIARTTGRSRKTWLVVSIIANVGVLAFFKYYNFLLDSFEPLIHLASPTADIPFLKILLPIGLSFHTFQAMSYTIEVYRGKQTAENDFLTYALYVMFYPQLVAGPIERPQNVLPQLHHFQEYDRNNIREGLARMLWGLFKKAVIADRLAVMVDYCYNHTSTLSSASLLVGAIFYSFQIYCDFSGYCDIGIGAAKIMGIRLMENFNEPYMSGSISRFWARWHISLSTWFRDYVYIPLGGNRLGEKRRKINVLFVFLLSGLWHGANWTFVVWGGLHGMLTAFLPGKRQDQRSNAFFKNAVFTLINFMIVTLFWVFFRSPSIKESFHYLGRIFNWTGGPFYAGLKIEEVWASVVLIVIMLLRERFRKSYFIKSGLAYVSYFVVMVIVCYMLGVFNENQFIYFQF